MKCSVDGCDRAADVRGWCRAHYKRWRRHGDPTAGQPPRGDAQRFVGQAIAYIGDACLTWPFARSRAGYGIVRIGGRNHIVSRFICETVNGAAPTPLHEAAHSCGKGHEGCVNPRHLRWATSAENGRDMVEDGNSTRGQKNARAKLTEVDARQIIRLHRTEHQKVTARRFGVSVSQICAIQNGKSWAWLSEKSR
jgi:hypothetical protein